MPIVSPTVISPHRIGGKKWLTYCTPLITEENEYFITEDGSYFCADEEEDEE